MTKLDKFQCQHHAKKLREYAKSYLADGLRRWQGEAEMISMVRGDAKDFREVAKLLRAGKVKEAFSRADSMDTAPREQIPDDVWNAMHYHVYPQENY
tara:strand:- start:2829 stop:3119 length:291 start_codon:yes stop_codon:yes gene_type:complete